MPYPLTIKTSERPRTSWEGDESSDPNSIPQRRSSISAPGELNYRHANSANNLTRTNSVSADEIQHELSTPKVNLAASAASSRVERGVERLARERQEREQHLRSNGCYTPGDEVDRKSETLGENGMVGGGGDGAAERLVVPEPQSSRSRAGAHTDGYENSGKPHRNTQRLLVVANRLPVSAIPLDGDKWDLQLSAGGLVSALLGVKHNFETRWIGWAGVSVKNDTGRASLTEALATKGCVPVFLDDDTVDQYYNGYCNNVLWPLFHYIGLPQEDRLAATRSLDSQFKAYQHANKLFAKVVFEQYQEGDVVWCHDYHLMCLPEELKKLNPHMKVGWFLHTPFPSSEIYRTLPLRSELLKAVLTADLIGFHTYDYARHFVSACTRILGLEGTPEGVEDQGKLTRVAAFPIGIDPDRFIKALGTEQVKLHVKELLRFFAGRKVMLGVDRLDMIKGIPQKLLAFEMFLEKNPEWREKVMLVQIAVPTRTDVPECQMLWRLREIESMNVAGADQRLTSQVHEIVGRINGRYGSVTFVPIHHLDRSLAFHELCALYASTDVALVTSLRDGMNLVSYEYVACQSSKNTEGVLVLSEFAGAAQSLGAGAILVNPWNIREMYRAIEEALNMPDEERKERHRHNFAHVNAHTAQTWADNFVSELNDTIVEAELRTLHIPPNLPVDTARENFRRSKNRLLIMGFNSTITATVEAPRRDQIRESKLGLHPGIKESLETLCSDPDTEVVILSGSTREALDEVFPKYDIWLAAENGMYLRDTLGQWTPMMEHLNMDWKESVLLVFDYFSARTPRSYVEKRETSLVWNYKYADVEFGRVQARNMLQHLWTGPISNAAVDVVQGSKSVEVRPIGVSKGAAIDRIVFEIIHRKDPVLQFDFVMCLGHFLSKDEDVYAYFDPELSFDRDHPCNNGKMEKGLDRRLSAKSCDRILAKNNKLGVLRTKTYPLISPDRNGTHLSSSHSKSNSFKDRKYSERNTMDDLVNVSSDTYVSCAVGRKRSAARFSVENVNEVGWFVKTLADACRRESDSGDYSVSSVSSGSGHHMFKISV